MKDKPKYPLWRTSEGWSTPMADNKTNWRLEAEQSRERIKELETQVKNARRNKMVVCLALGCPYGTDWLTVVEMIRELRDGEA